MNFHSKSQPSVETGTFGSEFCAMETAVEIIKSLRCKLRIFRMSLDSPASIYVTMKRYERILQRLNDFCQRKITLLLTIVVERKQLHKRCAFTKKLAMQNYQIYLQN